MELSLRDLNPIVLVGYRTALQQTVNPATVNTHIAALRTWGRWLADQGYLPENPAARLGMVTRQQATTGPKALTSTQVNALLRQTQSRRYATRDYAIMQMLVQTGMRIGECVALCWEDVTLGEKQGQVLIRMGKGNRSRVVPLNGSVRQALASYAAPYLHTTTTLKAVAMAWPTSILSQPGQSLWRSQKGHLTLESMDRIIKEVIRACVARNLIPQTTTAHSLRHTFATCYLARHPADLMGLAQLLGHRSLESTRIYVSRQWSS